MNTYHHQINSKIILRDARQAPERKVGKQINVLATTHRRDKRKTELVPGAGYSNFN